MDLSIYHSLNNFAFHHTAVADIAKFFANDVIFITIALLALLCLFTGRLAPVRDRRGVLAGLVCAAVAVGVAALIGHLWYRARPFVAPSHHAHLLVQHARDASFPSDHVSALAGIAVALLLWRRRTLGLIVLAVTVLVAVARVMVGVHYPSDVLGGFGDGLLVGLVVFALVPLRRLIDWIADRLGGIYDGVMAGARARLGRGETATLRR